MSSWQFTLIQRKSWRHLIRSDDREPRTGGQVDRLPGTELWAMITSLGRTRLDNFCTSEHTTTQPHTVIDHTSQTRHRFILSSKIRELKYEAENLNFIQVCSDWTLMLILLFWEVLDVNSDAARGRHGTALRRTPPRGGHTGIWSELQTKFKTRNEK